MSISQERNDVIIGKENQHTISPLHYGTCNTAVARMYESVNGGIQ